ncbi:MAG: Hpt domain-containing protein, partial [Halobacteriota archaeon]
MSEAHRNAFVHESQEGITELNNALLALEGDPDDEAAMDSIFRIAHTLKGNAAAMGFERVSGLAHALEDLLDEVRSGEIDVTIELMDLLFDGVDHLEAMVAEIADEGETTIDVDDLEAELRSIAEGDVAPPNAGGADDETADQSTDESGADEADVDSAATTDAEADDETPDTGSDDEATDADVDDEATESATEPHDSAAAGDVEIPESLSIETLQDGQGIYRATVSVGDSSMPGVDAIFVLDAVEDAYEEFATRPDRETIEDGDFDDAFDVFVVATGPEEIQAGLSALSKVESVTVTAAAPTASGEETGDDPATTPADGAGDESSDGDTSKATSDEDANASDEDANASDEDA